MQARMKNGLTRLFFAALGIFLLSSAAVADASTVQYRYDELDRLYRAGYEDGTIVEYGYDNVGNRMEQRIVDITPPVTTATPPGGQYFTGVTVSLSCSDGPGGSGCDKIYYTWNVEVGEQGQAVLLDQRGEQLDRDRDRYR